MATDAQRPAVDVVVPFAGSERELAQLARRVESLELRGDDTLTVVDNRFDAAPGGVRGSVTMLGAPERQSSYFARNRGAGAGANAWIVFLDADVIPPADLIARYFEPSVGERVAVLAGDVVDEPLVADEERDSLAMRYAMLTASMSQANTLNGAWAYAQTANCAVRRSAFEHVGGFREHLRSGGDADLCFRLRAAGWSLERRPDAHVVHRSRRTMRRLLRQKARHGSGAAWLDREYPGSFPRRRPLGLAKWTVQSLAAAAAARSSGRADAAVVAAVEPFVQWAFEVGRLFPNEVRAR
jgi:GT2 family glycosyltransferase